MNKQHFENQLARLADTYGAHHYKPERVKILWKALESFSDDWLTNQVSHFIGHLRQAPLMPEFQEAISHESDRLYNLKKREQTKEAEEFMSSYGAEDIQTICKQIVARVKGQMPDQDFNCFVKMLSPPHAIACRKCDDSGFYFDAEIGGNCECMCHARKMGRKN